MKDHLRRLIQAGSPIQQRNLVREYLQARILAVLQRRGAMIPLAFHGGTALRFIYAIPRYSEDLDFALERTEAGYDFRGYLTAIRDELGLEGYAVTVRLSDEKTVHSAFVRFPGLLYEMGVSPHADEVIAVKLEVDTRPPAGAGLATTIVRRHVLLNVQHHDPASLLAGKIHALLQRPYTKGRDVYDLFWYLSDRTWPPPNLDLLNHALAQTGWIGPEVKEDNWRGLLRERLAGLDWPKILSDVSPFVETEEEMDLLTLENLVNLLGNR